jgi:hypothetical protein
MYLEASFKERLQVKSKDKCVTKAAKSNPVLGRKAYQTFKCIRTTL